jgi:hypothetical protein
MRRNTHSKKQRGQVLIIVTVLFSAAAMAVVFGVISPTIREVQISRDFQTSKQSYYTAEAASEDAFYRIRGSISITFPETLGLAGATSTVSVITTGFDSEQLRSEASFNNLVRVVLKDLTVTEGFDFSYAMQSGIGGIYLFNNSAVNGDVYSNGPIVGASSNPNSYNLVQGGIVSASATGSVTQVHSTGSVYSHYITSATIDKDAYYQSFNKATSSVTVTGTKHPNSPDQPNIPLPVNDDLITSWETDAAAGGSVTCTNGSYSISASVSLGPKKIPCNLSVTGNATVVSLTGPVWVTGNISFNGSGGSGVQMRVADSVGNRTVVMIADNSADRLGSGLVTITGNSNFYGSTGNADSYVMVVSQNKSAEVGGSVLAIDVINGAAGNLLIYAPHGQIKLENNVNLREVTAYKLTLINNTVVNYYIGLAQTLFTSGSGGAWKIKHWMESI